MPPPRAAAPPSPHAASTLTGLGSWRLGALLGAGERATVYRATHAAQPTQVRALKVIHAHLAADSAARSAFEARLATHRALSELHHPNIVACHALDHASGRSFAVLDALDGISLDRLIPAKSRRKLPLDAAANLLIAALDALSAAANLKLLHGGLNANDLLIQEDGRVALTGFGQPGAPHTDFLHLHRLAQAMKAPWPPEVDAWLDQLADADTPWPDVRTARAAFPLGSTDTGRRSLERLVRNYLKKHEIVSDSASTAGLAAASSAPAPRGSPQAASRRTSAASKPSSPRLSAARPPPSPGALRQARLTVTLAVVVVLIGLLIMAFRT